MPLRVYSFNGFPVHYRMENRKKCHVLVVKFKDTMPGNKNKVLFERDMRIPKDLAGEPDDVILANMLPKLFAKHFCKAALPQPAVRIPKPDAAKGKVSFSIQVLKAGRFRWFPFAAIWYADMQDLAEEEGWAKSSLEEYRRAADWVIQHFGSLPLPELTPDIMSSRLMKQSPRKIETVCRLMRAITLYEWKQGNYRTSNPWLTYHPKVNAGHKPAGTLMARQIYDNMLTNKQVYTLLQACREKWEQKHDWFAISAALWIITGLPLGALCALQIGDFQLLTFFPRLCIMIKSELRKKGRNYYREPILDPYQLRKLPLPSWLDFALADIADRAAREDPDAPFLHSCSNKTRVMNPKEFWQRFRREFPDIGFSNPLQFETTLRRTLSRNWSDHGMDDLEIRYMFGQHQQTTAAQHYTDFGNEGVLDKLAELQNRYLFNLVLHPPLFQAQNITLRPGKGHAHTAIAPGNIQRVTFAPMPPDGNAPQSYQLLVTASRGINITAFTRKKSLTS